MSVLEPWGGLKITFGRRHIGAVFGTPHRTLSTCRVFGGLREDLDCICNHQLCEPLEHTVLCGAACSDPECYLSLAAREFGLPARMALLTTAANMQCAGSALEEFEDCKVLAVSTAGVDGNASRAGDPASYAETGAGIVFLPPGTINIMVFFNVSLTPGAMLETAMLVAESKVSVLQELSVPSLYSQGLATGTGTDGLALAAPVLARGTGEPFTGTGKHSKLGEIVARSVRSSLFEALDRQNSLAPSRCCNALKLLARFGFSEILLRETACELLPPEIFAVFSANLMGIVTDPPAAAAAAALAHICDQRAWGVIPQSAYEDLLLDYAAMLASRTGGREELQAAYRAALDAVREKTPQKWNVALAAASALAMGFRNKWPE